MGILLPGSSSAARRKGPKSRLRIRSCRRLRRLPWHDPKVMPSDGPNRQAGGRPSTAKEWVHGGKSIWGPYFVTEREVGHGRSHVGTDGIARIGGRGGMPRDGLPAIHRAAPTHAARVPEAARRGLWAKSPIDRCAGGPWVPRPSEKTDFEPGRRRFATIATWEAARGFVFLTNHGRLPTYATSATRVAAQ